MTGSVLLNVDPYVKNVGSAKRGCLSWQWSPKTGFIVYIPTLLVCLSSRDCVHRWGLSLHCSTQVLNTVHTAAGCHLTVAHTGSQFSSHRALY